MRPDSLKAGAVRMARALHAAPRPLTRGELGTLSVVNTGGTMSDYLSAMRNMGMLQEKDGTIDLTPSGVLIVEGSGPELPKPMTPQEVVGLHEAKLKAGARRMMGYLLSAHPEGYTRAELGRLANVNTGGTFSDYLSALKKRGLTETRAKRIYASPTLYLWEKS